MAKLLGDQGVKVSGKKMEYLCIGGADKDVEARDFKVLIGSTVQGDGGSERVGKRIQAG